jgi:hypothetical protein
LALTERCLFFEDNRFEGDVGGRCSSIPVCNHFQSSTSIDKNIIWACLRSTTERIDRSCQTQKNIKCTAVASVVTIVVAIHKILIHVAVVGHRSLCGRFFD